MSEVSLFDAKNKLSALLDQVERGGEVVITRRGKRVARLVAVVESDKPRTAVERLNALRESIAARGESWSWADLKTYRDEGRR